MHLLLLYIVKNMQGSEKGNGRDRVLGGLKDYLILAQLGAAFLNIYIYMCMHNYVYLLRA